MASLLYIICNKNLHIIHLQKSLIAYSYSINRFFNQDLKYQDFIEEYFDIASTKNNETVVCKFIDSLQDATD